MALDSVITLHQSMVDTMDKSEFLHKFSYKPDKIRLLFDTSAFLQNTTIVITKDEVSLHTFLDYYVPKYSKEKKFDTRKIEEQIKDPAVFPLTIKEAMLKPAKWDLYMPDDNLPNVDQLYPIPMATDLKSGKTLLLDSSHTITTMLSKFNPDVFNNINLTIVRITGTGLEDIVCDFKILNRTSKK